MIEKTYNGEIEEEKFTPNEYNPDWVIVEAKKSLEERISNIESETINIKAKIEILEKPIVVEPIEPIIEK